MKTEAGLDRHRRDAHVWVQLSKQALNKLAKRQAIELPIRYQVAPGKRLKCGTLEVIPEGYDEFF